MSDTVSKLQRSRNMSRIRSRNTVPELRVRSTLHRAGFRFRVHSNELPGKPDVVLRKHKTVIFVHGCFWHRHAGCSRCSTPSSNEGYWIPKLAGNVVRDRVNQRSLTKLGWKVLVIWECETKDIAKLEKRLLRILRSTAKTFMED